MDPGAIKYLVRACRRHQPASDKRSYV